MGSEQPDIQVRLTRSPSVTVLGCTTVVSSDKETLAVTKTVSFYKIYSIFESFTFHRQISIVPACPSVVSGLKTKIIPSFMGVLYIVDLQLTVPLFVAHVLKAAGGKIIQPPGVRGIHSFRPED